MATKTPPLPASAPVITTPVLGRGRWLVDMRPYWGPFGWVYQWSVEDMDSDGDERTGLILGCDSASVVMNHEVCNAILGADGMARASKNHNHAVPRDDCPDECF